MKELFLVRGAPGAGKSTFAKTLAMRPDVPGFSYPHFENDMYIYNDGGEYEWTPERAREAARKCLHATEVAMKSENNRIVVSNTFNAEWQLEPYMNLAAKYGYRVTVLVVENRHGGKNIHNVDDEIVDSMKYRLLKSIRL